MAEMPEVAPAVAHLVAAVGSEAAVSATGVAVAREVAVAKEVATTREAMRAAVGEKAVP